MTIKTAGSESGLRVITKMVNGEVRVSCECCAAGCCMYPADELGGLYTAADLPDALTINWTGQFTSTVTKSGSGYSGGGITLQVVNNSWQLAQGSTTRSVGNCLIRGDGNLTAGNDLVEDQFEDTYTLTSIEGSIEVTRVSLCRWELPVEFGSPNLGGSLEYYLTNPMEGQPSPAWIAGMYDGQAGSPAGGEKTSPNLSSPVGTYTDLFLPSVTVS